MNKVLDIFSPKKNTVDPFDEFESELINMNNLLDVFSPFPMRNSLLSRPERMMNSMLSNFSTLLPLDVEERDNHYVITTDVPGFDEEDIDVSIENNVLSIVAESKTTDNDETDDKESSSLVKERYSHKRVERKINLGSRQLNLDNVSAELRNGVLTLAVPFAEESLPKKISIGVGTKSPEITEGADSKSNEKVDEKVPEEESLKT